VKSQQTRGRRRIRNDSKKVGATTQIFLPCRFNGYILVGYYHIHTIQSKTSGENKAQEEDKAYKYKWKHEPSVAHLSAQNGVWDL